jgi:hypothetical protein
MCMSFSEKKHICIWALAHCNIYNVRYCNILLKQLKHLKHTLATYVYSQYNIYNIQIKTLTTYIWKQLKYLKHTLATYVYSQRNIYNVQIKTLTIYVWNNWNILKHTLTTYMYSNYNICNFQIYFLQHTSRTSRTIDIHVALAYQGPHKYFICGSNISGPIRKLLLFMLTILSWLAIWSGLRIFVVYNYFLEQRHFCVRMQIDCRHTLL